MNTLELPPNLKAWMAEQEISAADIARGVGAPHNVVCRAINHGRWPVRSKRRLHKQITAWLAARGLPPTQEKAPERVNAPRPSVTPTNQAEGDEDMVINKPTLYHATRQHFGLRADPFGDPNQIEDIYLSRDMRGVSDLMREAATWPGKFLVVVGESGSGKTTLTDGLLDRLMRSAAPVTVIRPMVLRSTDKTEAGRPAGKPITTQFIGDAIMESLAPGLPVASSDYRRQKQLERTLIDSARAGQKHLILIEEAHDLSRTMLKHLKRLLEIRDGLARTLSVLLIAQPEILLKLDPNDRNMREVVARAEIVTLPPLDNELNGYLKHRFERIGADVDAVIDSAAIDALRERMTVSGRGRRSGSMLYPLAVHNALTAAMNTAADLGAPKVTRDIVAGGAQ